MIANLFVVDQAGLSFTHSPPQCQPCPTPLRPGLSTQDHLPSGLCKVLTIKYEEFFSVIYSLKTATLLLVFLKRELAQVSQH